jgi:hypothetical protein
MEPTSPKSLEVRCKKCGATWMYTCPSPTTINDLRFSMAVWPHEQAEIYPSCGQAHTFVVANVGCGFSLVPVSDEFVNKSKLILAGAHTLPPKESN